MKLVLEGNADVWPVRLLPPGPLPVTGPSDELVVLVRPFDPLLNFWGPWKTAMLQWGAPEGGSIDVVTEVKAMTDVDWPIEVIESLVKDKAGTVVGARITVLYFFLEWCSMAAVCGKPEAIAAERDRAIALLRSGRPDWSGSGVVAIAALYG